MPSYDLVRTIRSGSGRSGEPSRRWGVVDPAIAADGTVDVAEPFAGVISEIADGVPVTVAAVGFPTAIDVGPDGTLDAATAPAIVGAPLPGAVVTIDL